MTKSKHPHASASLTLAGMLISVFLVGCSGQPGSAVSGPTAPIVTGSQGKIKGNVHGGQQPVNGAVIQLYAVGMTGYTSGATPLIPSADQLISGNALTTSTGSFDITGDYTCPTGSYVYITASGGNPGAGINTNLALMAALGP